MILMSNDVIQRFFRILSNDNRKNVLKVLAGTGDDGMRMTDLAKTLNASSNTINHHVIKLVHNGMVSKTGSVYHITEFGMSCLKYYKEFEKLVAGMYRRG